MIYSVLIGVGVVIAALLVVGFSSTATFFASFSAMGWLSKLGKDEYFNIRYRHRYGSGFYRAHLVGMVNRLDNRVVYVVEIHPDDAAKADAWTVWGAELRGGYLLEKGKFYRYALKEELYD